MGDRRAQWEREKRDREFKKRRRQMVHDSRNRIRASTKTWEDLKKETTQQWKKKH